MTHQRRSKGKASTTVTVAANMATTIKKDQFLANQKNKQQFIFLLSAELEKNSCNTYHATGDADLLIVQKAVQSATTSKTVLVGEDIDLIVLLCYHANFDYHDIFFCSEKKLCLEYQSHKRKAWSRHLQQHPLHPRYSWV